MTKNKTLIRYFINGFIGILGTALVLFLSAGRIDWWQAWACICVAAGLIIAMDIIILWYNPGLAAERLGVKKGSKPWDAAILSILNLSGLARYMIAGLDRRFGWTYEFPFPASIIGLVFCVLGYSFFLWAVGANTFFSQVVRIQVDRGHVVATDGPTDLSGTRHISVP